MCNFLSSVEHRPIKSRTLDLRYIRSEEDSKRDLERKPDEKFCYIRSNSFAISLYLGARQARGIIYEELSENNSSEQRIKLFGPSNCVLRQEKIIIIV